MTHTRTKSSNVYSIAHEGLCMEVRFACGRCNGAGAGCDLCGGKGHGATYTYQGVSGAVYESILKANSVGKEFSARVRGKYKFTKGKL